MLQQDYAYFEHFFEDITSLDDKVLETIVIAVSRRCFQKEFKHQAYFNTRLKTTGGRYHLKTHDIDINPRVWQLYGWEELVDVVIHELCHYHLHLEGKGHNHRDHAFKELLRLTGGSRYVKPLVDELKEKPYVYQCEACQLKYPRVKKVNVLRYRCRCGGKLKKIKGK